MTTVAPAPDDGPTPTRPAPAPARVDAPAVRTSAPVAGSSPRRVTSPPTSGLYDPRFEHDACGVAFVADLQGRASHRLVLQAISALEHLAHRGATGSEEDSGDGAGILIQVPDAFYRQAVDFPLPERGRYATGIAFLSRDEDESARAR
jgi:glutamate synthase (NADPH/NADH) large chain